MYSIEWKSVGGYTYTHSGTHRGIRELLTHELKGCTYKAVGPRKFRFDSKEQIAEEDAQVERALAKRAEERYLARHAA